MHVYGFTYEDFHSVPYLFVLAEDLAQAVGIYGAFATHCRTVYGDAEFPGPDTKGIRHQMSLAAEIGQDGLVKFLGNFTSENFTGSFDDQLVNFAYEGGRAVRLIEFPA